MKPLAAIVRSSDGVSERQRRGTYHGDEDQLAEIRHYARARDLPFVVLEPELDVSGGKPIDERPSLRAAIEGVEAGKYSGIITANLKRLTRSRSGIEIWDRVEAAGGHVHCAAENLDTTTPNGRFVRDIHLAEAVREREEHAERHARRREQTVAAGIWRPRQLPRGYQFAGPAVGGQYRGAARKLVPGRDADDVLATFEARHAGASLSELARRLGMTTSGVRALLANRVYLGELRDGDNVNPRAHRPIVSEDLWLAVQHMSVVRPARRPGPPALLAGLVTCAGCGHTMSRSDQARAIVYTCHRQYSGGLCPSPAGITMHRLDSHVTEIVLDHLDRLHHQASFNDNEVRTARAAVRIAENELAAYLEGVTAAGLAPETFAAGARQRQAAIDNARTRLGQLIAAVPAGIGDIEPRQAWERMDDAQRNRLSRSLIEAVLVASAGRGRLVPVVDRVRVIAHGAGLVERYRGGGGPMGIRSIPLPDRDDVRVMRVEF